MSNLGQRKSIQDLDRPCYSNENTQEADFIRLIMKTAEGEMSISPSSTSPIILDSDQTPETRNQDDINKFY